MWQSGGASSQVLWDAALAGGQPTHSECENTKTGQIVMQEKKREACSYCRIDLLAQCQHRCIWNDAASLKGSNKQYRSSEPRRSPAHLMPSGAKTGPSVQEQLVRAAHGDRQSKRRFSHTIQSHELCYSITAISALLHYQLWKPCCHCTVAHGANVF